MGQEISYEFKQKVNKKGFFCNVRYLVESLSDEKLEVVFLADTRWQAACQFAANLFYEKYSLIKSGGIKITIKEVESQMIDTNQVVVFYALLSALSEHFDIDSGIRVNEFGDFVVEK